MGKSTIPLNSIFSLLTCVTVKSESFNVFVSVFNSPKMVIFKSEIFHQKSIITSNCLPHNIYHTYHS